MISYTVIISATGLLPSVSIRALLGSNEIVGSAITKTFTIVTVNQVCTNFFIVSIENTNQLTLQFAGSIISSETITPSTAIAGETPISAAITVTRIA
jgi:hypothetical protein